MVALSLSPYLFGLVARWSLPLSYYPLGLSHVCPNGSPDRIKVRRLHRILSLPSSPLSLSLHSLSLVMNSAACSGSAAAYSPTAASSSAIGLTGVRYAKRVKPFSTSASTSTPSNTRLRSRNATSPSLPSRRMPSSRLGLRLSRKPGNPRFRGF